MRIARLGDRPEFFSPSTGITRRYQDCRAGYEPVGPLKAIMRAPRFPLQLPVHYRPVGAESEWRRATTGNVSASGVLVKVPEPLQVDTRIEFRLGLEAAAPPAERAEVCGLGRVVRILSTGESPYPGFAVVFEDYAFKHRPAPAPS